MYSTFVFLSVLFNDGDKAELKLPKIHILIYAVKPLLPKATPIVRPDFKCTEIVKSNLLST